MVQCGTGCEKTTRGVCTADRHGTYPPDLNGFKHNQQPMPYHDIRKCGMKTTKLRFSQIVTPFQVLEQDWNPKTVITLGDDRGGTLDVKLLKLLCFTHTRYRDKVADARRRENDGLCKRMHVGCQSI